MAVRIRADGEIVCAALRPWQEGDTYLDDGIHYRLSVVHHVLVTDANHMEHARWWWADAVPAGVEIDRWWER